MKYLGYCFVFLFFISPSLLLANNYHTPFAPQDTSSSIFDRVASTYLIEQGKKIFYQGRNRDAMGLFRKAYLKDKTNWAASYWIGMVHYKLSNYGYSLQYAKQAKKLNDKKSGDITYLIATSFHQIGKLDSAMAYYDYSKNLLSKKKIKAYQLADRIKEVQYAEKVAKKTIQFKKQLLDYHVNSGYNDYDAVLADSGKTLYFVSRRPDTKGGHINPADQQYFEDIYKSSWNADYKNWTKGTNKIERLNTEGFDAIGYVSADGLKAYLTVNTAIIETSNPTKSSDICISKKTKKGRWTKANAIVNKDINTSFFDGAPTLTEDEQTMYFASDRDGKKTLTDIYVVHKNGHSWGKVKKLPANINSTGNETTPYITPDGQYLFFSSDGHLGMGKYDVFVSKYLGNGKWTDPVNLGPEFNTVRNDLYFRYYPKLHKAYISTARMQGKKASLDIFSYDLKGWEFLKGVY